MREININIEDFKDFFISDLIISDLIDNSKITKITHNDLDGYASSEFIEKFINKYNKNEPNTIIYNYNYSYDELNKKYNIENSDIIIITDISFENNNSELLFNLSKINCPIWWIDHHQSSIDFIRNNKEKLDNLNIKYFVDTDFCATTNVYNLLFDEAGETEIYKRISEIVNDHDLWIKKIPESSWLNYAFYNVDNRDEFIETVFSDEENLNSALEEGRKIEKIKLADYANARRSAYEVELEDGTKAIVMNHTGNSIMFGDLYHQYDLCISWGYNKFGYRYTIYSDGKFNCKEFAEAHGGGGHIFCAGFRSDKLLFPASFRR